MPTASIEACSCQDAATSLPPVLGVAPGGGGCVAAGQCQRQDGGRNSERLQPAEAWAKDRFIRVLPL